MAVSTNTPSEPNNEKAPNNNNTQMKSTEVNVLDEKITYTANLKTCHQCRQRTANLMAYCKNPRSSNNKPCPIKFCHRCLLNRYGEKAEDVALLDDWKCPKCRDVCNCSNCRKKKGHQPTGCLVRSAKASGFSSVSEMLIAKGPENFSSLRSVKVVGSSQKIADASSKEKVANSPIKRGKENSNVGNSEANVLMSPIDLITVASSEESKQKILRTNDASSNVDQGCADEGLKLENESIKDSCVLEEIKLNPVKKAKKLKERDDGEMPEKNGLKKQRISKEVAPKILGTNETSGNVDPGSVEGLKLEEIKLNPVKKAKKLKGMDDGERSEKNDCKKLRISKEVTPKILGTNDASSNVDQGSVEEGLKLEEIKLNPVKKAKKLKGRDDGEMPEKNGLKKQRISKGVAPNDVKKDVKVSKVDDAGPLEKTDSQSAMETSVEPIDQQEQINKSEDSLRSRDEKEVPVHKNNCNGEAKLKPSDKLKKNTKKGSDIEVQWPQGIVLTSIVDIDLPVEDVGPALQFLEFCKAFGKVFDLRKGHAESLLRELTCGSSRLRRRQCSPVIKFQMQLLSLIQKNLGEDSSLSPTSSGKLFLQALQKCVSASHCKLEELPLNCFDMDGDMYDQLDSSKKLRILNFLCDEALGTVDLRTWIDKQNFRFAERKREATLKVMAAKDKEKQMKQKIQDEMANGSSLSIAERDDILSTLQVEAEKAHAEVLEAIPLVPKDKQNSDAVRTQPVLLDGNGHVFWRLIGYSRDSDVLLQDIGSLDTVTREEKWFTYGVEQKQAVEKCISSLRCRKKKIRKQTVPNGSSDASIEEETSNDKASPITITEENSGNKESQVPSCSPSKSN